ncbi:MAG: extracellular solute-binding protein [Terriglobales bacterium]
MRRTRRAFLRLGAGALVAAPLALAARPAAEAAEVATAGSILEVAYAGSMGAVMEGPVRAALAALGLELRGRAQGATALARLIAAGSLRPDVFLSATAEPLRIVAAAGKVARSTPFAHTGMVIAYAPGSRFAAEWKQRPWWQVMQQPGFRLGRSDPRTDPQGRNFIFVCRLAEQFYHQPGLARRLLGEVLNPAQIFTEASLEARVETGQLDAAPAYRFQPAPLHLECVELPGAINLSTPPAFPVELTLGEATWRPEPLDFYAAVLKGAPHPAAARRFATWMEGPDGQKLLKDAGYG